MNADAVLPEQAVRGGRGGARALSLARRKAIVREQASLSLFLLAKACADLFCPQLAPQHPSLDTVRNPPDQSKRCAQRSTRGRKQAS
eukprot:122722-Alexandrium_andersonii.AAC.1